MWLSQWLLLDVCLRFFVGDGRIEGLWFGLGSKVPSYFQISFILTFTTWFSSNFVSLFIGFTRFMRQESFIHLILRSIHVSLYWSKVSRFLHLCMRFKHTFIRLVLENFVIFYSKLLWTHRFVAGLNLRCHLSQLPSLVQHSNFQLQFPFCERLSINHRIPCCILLINTTLHIL